MACLSDLCSGDEACVIPSYTSISDLTSRIKGRYSKYIPASAPFWSYLVQASGARCHTPALP